MLKLLLCVGTLACLASAGGTNEKGLKYLEENKGKEGVITLASGMQYKVRCRRRHARKILHPHAPCRRRRRRRCCRRLH